jgi:hypothetical protein
METIDTTVYCSHPSFRAELATYKIAATWTGGDYSELKTYGFAHDGCVAEVYAQAALRAGRFEPRDGETLGELRVFRLDLNRRDHELEIADEAERIVRAALNAKINRT